MFIHTTSQHLPPSCQKTTHHILKNTMRRTLNTFVALLLPQSLETSPKLLPYFTGNSNPHPTLLPPFENQACRYHRPHNNTKSLSSPNKYTQCCYHPNTYSLSSSGVDTLSYILLNSRHTVYISP